MKKNPSPSGEFGQQGSCANKVAGIVTREGGGAIKESLFVCIVLCRI